MSTHLNTQPNTPFGHLFDKMGIWHPHIEGGIKALYERLQGDEQIAVKTASGWIAIVNNYLQETPENVFKMIQLKFPDVTKESITDTLNKLNAKILHLNEDLPASFEGAMEILQTYLSKFEGHTWAAITRMVVSVLTDIFLKGASPIDAVESVLTYVYHIFVKPNVNA